MVYKLSDPSRGGKVGLFWWICLRYGLMFAIIIWVVAHFFLPEISSLEDGEVLALSVCGGVLACVFSFVIILQNFRRFKSRGDIFITLTEAGMMVEIPSIGEKQYQPWQRFSHVRRVKNMLILQRVHGLVDLLPLDALSPVRAEEMENYCREHVGQIVSPEALIRPPAEYKSPTPYVREDSVAIRREVADALIRHVSPLTVQQLMICVPIFIAASILLIWGSIQSGMIQDIGLAVFALALLLLTLRSYVHPGFRMRKWIHSPEPGETHVTRNHVMLCTACTWVLLSAANVSRCLQMRRSYVYEVSRAGVFAISRDEQPAASLPQPQPACTLRRMVQHAVVLFLLPALLLGAVGLIPESEEEQGLKAYREAARRGDELTAYVEALTPVRGYPGSISLCLCYDAGVGNSFFLCISWDDDTSCQLYLGDDEDLLHDD